MEVARHIKGNVYVFKFLTGNRFQRRSGDSSTIEKFSEVDSMKLLSIPIILAIIFLGSCSHQTDIASLDRADILAIAFYVCLTLVVIFMVSSFILYLYYRDKIQYNKRRIKMMLRNKNAEILELSHKNYRKNNDITLLTTKLSCWEKNNNRYLPRTCPLSRN
jgi:hypothetical protein